MQQIIHKITGLFLMPLVVVLAISGGDAFNLSNHGAGQPSRQVLLRPRLLLCLLPSWPMRSNKLIRAPHRLCVGPQAQIIAYYYENGVSGAELIDPTSGASLGAYQPSGTQIWLTDLHRSLFLGDGGRVAAGMGAAAMLLICMSGLIMLKRRMGGWAQLFKPIRGSLSQRLHLEISRFAILGLSLSAFTGLYMTAATFGLARGWGNDDRALPAR